MTDKIIFPESDEAAKRATQITGWVSRHDRFYGEDERAARWGGATHVHCSKCGGPTPKAWLVCEDCRAKQAQERYLEFPQKEWDEIVPAYSPVTDTYYWSWEEVQEDNCSGILSSIDMQLVLCKPVYAPGVDPEMYYEDLLPEYHDLCDVSPTLVRLFQELNDALTDSPVVLSYEPTNTAVI